MNIINAVQYWSLVAAALAGWAFMILYTKRWTWWRDEHGAHLGFFTLSLTLIMTLYVFRPLFDPVTFAYVRAPLWELVALCMVWRLVLYTRSNWRGRRARRLRR